MSESKTQSKSSFIKLFIAMVTGDETEVKAQKTAAQAKSALKSQINAQEGELEDCKVAVDEAKERLNEALINNGNPMKGAAERTRYTENLLLAKNVLTDAEEAVEDKMATIKFFQEQLSLV